MQIRAQVRNAGPSHVVTVATDGHRRTLDVAPKPDGTGSSINGGEMLCLALATCYCNDLYREATRRGIRLSSVEVDVHSEFGAAGEPARRITYTARVTSDGASSEELDALLHHTDQVAEVHNTLRAGIAVELQQD